MAQDAIIIRGLDLPVRIGVPDAERSAWQTLSADLEIELQPGFDTMRDELGETLDYGRVAEEVRALAAARPRRLLETLAAEIVAALLGQPRAMAVTVELRKRILPGVDHVAVRMSRRRE